MHERAKEVLKFWFEEIKPAQWFTKDIAFDQLVQNRFFETYQDASREGTHTWRTSPEGRLAEIIVLDQFPRNMFRDTPRAFATDGVALRLAREAVAVGDDQKIEVEKRAFMYMPYMHSEDLVAHEEAMKLFALKGLEDNLKFEELHKAIIERFGRYPHRNAILGRPSTDEELAFLKTKGSSF